MILVKCATSDGFFCPECYHSEPHEHSPDCFWRENAIVESRRRICNCLNNYTKCKELREGKDGE